jgi:transcriptional regulator with XRE-family HTH domain
LRKEFERELLYEEAIETVAALVKSIGLSQKELARRLDLSEARISRILNGRDNTTLRTIADVGYALGVRFALVPIAFEDRVGTPAEDDRNPPAWIDRQRKELLSTKRAPSPAPRLVDR